MKIATAYVELRIDRKKAEQEAKQAAGDIGKDAGDRFGQIFGAAAFAGGIAKSIDSASKLQQAVGATETVFGSARGAVETFAKTSAESFGISERAARDLTSGIGALLQNFGFTADEAANTSVQLAKLGADLAAAFGGNPEEAVQALGAALRGENDPVERFGISLNDARVKAKALELGLYDGVGSLEANAKAQATLALITEQTAKVQGQAGREADTAAGQQARAAAKAEDAAASLGENFLPIYTKAAELVGDLASAFGALPGPVQTGVVALVGLVALSGPIKTTISVVKDLSKAISSVAEKASSSGSAVKGFGAGAAIALGLVALAMVGQAHAAKQAADRNKELEEGMRDLSSVAEDQLAATLDGILANAIAQNVGAGKDLQETYNAMAEANIEGTRRALEFAKAQGRSQFEIDLLTAAIEKYEAELGQAAVTNQEFATDTGTTIGAVRDLGEAWKLGGDRAIENAEATAEAKRETRLAGIAAEASKDAIESLSDAVDDSTNIYDELAGAADRLRSALDKVFGSTVSMEEANRAYAAGVDSLKETLKENGDTLDLNTEKGRANRQAIQDQVGTILDYGAAVVGAGGSTDDATNSIFYMTEGLKDQLRQAGLTEDQINDYIATLGLTPENVTTAIDLANDEVTKEKIAGLIEQLGTVDAGAVAEIEALVAQGQLDEALRKLEKLLGYDGKTVTTTTRVRGGGNTAALPTATGGFFPGGANSFRTVAEVPGRIGDEVVLPLGDRDRLSRLVNDPRSQGRIAAALGNGGGSGSTTLSATVNNYNQPVTVDVVSYALAMARFS